MLEKSIKHPRVEYCHYDGNYLDFPNECFDIITFAGSLYYAKSQQLLDEVVRVSKHTAKILVYDFELFLNDIMGMLKVCSYSTEGSGYNHQEGFYGLNQESIRIEEKLKNQLTLGISVSDLSHLLLSSKDNYSLLLENIGGDNLFNEVAEKLQSFLRTEEMNVKAITYLSIYSIIKK